MDSLGVFISSSGHNELSHTGWIQRTEIDSLTLWRPEVRSYSVASRILAASGGSGISWFVTQSLQSLPPWSYDLLPLCQSFPILFKKCLCNVLIWLCQGSVLACGVFSCCMWDLIP